MCAYCVDDAVLVEANFGQQARLVTMINEAVGQSDTDKLHGAVDFLEHAGNFRAGATDQGVLFDADQQ